MHPIANNDSLNYPLALYAGNYFSDFSTAPLSNVLDAEAAAAHSYSSSLFEDKTIYGPRPHNMERILCFSNVPPKVLEGQLTCFLMGKGYPKPKTCPKGVAAHPYSAVATILIDEAKVLALHSNILRNWLLFTGLPVLPDSSFCPALVQLSQELRGCTKEPTGSDGEDQALEGTGYDSELESIINNAVATATSRRDRNKKRRAAKEANGSTSGQGEEGIAPTLTVHPRRKVAGIVTAPKRIVKRTELIDPFK
jgi:hypothetical protein